jgi:uracil-DNA glycosylase
MPKDLTDSTRFHGRSLAELRTAIDECRACPLWERATKGVPGEGNSAAKVMLVGEQPGDQEDVSGHPFVGPAGRLLDVALIQAGIDRQEVFITNVVKHFSWYARGKRRMHKTPAQQEIVACFDWLLAEIGLVRPEVIVCLGATAAKALLGSDFRVSVERGRLIEGGPAPVVLTTVHPSSILRIVDSAERAQALEGFTADLKRIHDALRLAIQRGNSSAPRGSARRGWQRPTG